MPPTAAGLGLSKDELDRYGRAIPDEEYETRDFERVVAIRARTDTIARRLTDFLKKTDRFASGQWPTAVALRSDVLVRIVRGMGQKCSDSLHRRSDDFDGQFAPMFHRSSTFPNGRPFVGS
jgi:hypothetical protein